MVHFNSKWKNPSRYKDNTGKLTTYYLYTQWSSMRNRCKTNGAYQARKPTYVGSTFCEDWLSYDNYHEWAEQQVGFNCQDEDGDYFRLDKDALGEGSKHYSPHNCVLIPKKINSFFSYSEGDNNGLPTGVSFKKSHGRFVAYGTDMAGTSVHLGLFDIPEEAHAAYVVNKEAKAKQLAEFYKDVIDVRVYEKLMSFKA